MLAHPLRALLLGCLLAAPHAQAHAQAQGPGDPPAEKKAVPQVFTPATVASVFDTDAGAKHYIRLKLGPNQGLPFRTLTFRVRDPALIAPFPPGSGVAFIAQRLDGENTLTALRAAPKPQRF